MKAILHYLDHMDEVEFLMCTFLFHLLFIFQGSELVPNKRDILQVWSLIHQLCFKKAEEKHEFHKTAEKHHSNRQSSLYPRQQV